MEKVSPKNKIKEIQIQRRLEKETGGRHRKCKNGVTDITTDKELIEIKAWSRYKEAFGQLLFYGRHFPGRQKKIRFFGEKPKNDETLKEIYQVAKEENIIIEDELEIQCSQLISQFISNIKTLNELRQSIPNTLITKLKESLITQEAYDHLIKFLHNYDRFDIKNFNLISQSTTETQSTTKRQSSTKTQSSTKRHPSTKTQSTTKTQIINSLLSISNFCGLHIIHPEFLVHVQKSLYISFLLI